MIAAQWYGRVPRRAGAVYVGHWSLHWAVHDVRGWKRWRRSIVLYRDIRTVFRLPLWRLDTRDRSDRR